MPSADAIVRGLGVIAREWTFLALMWPAYYGLLWSALLLGWRPPQAIVGALQVPPLVSVSTLAWLGGNPFNGVLFAVLAVTLSWICTRLPGRSLALTSPAWRVAAAALVVFAWIYPHFLDDRPLYAYLYAAPLGLIPCPTLSMVVGTTILLKGLGSRAWSLIIAFAGAFYGLFGALRLGVKIDWVLAAGALAVLMQLAVKHPKPTQASG